MASGDNDAFYCGVIEGFYGIPWSWDDRWAYAEFLSEAGYGTYIYAPKSDRYLRSAWSQPWPDNEFENLTRLAQYYEAANIRWGLGLSPLNLFQEWNASNRQLLNNKLKLINQLKPDVLCVLFDDMRGDVENLALSQINIVQTVAAQCDADKLIVCPTYYSRDPVLESLFGVMPQGYWQALGDGLDADIDLFWTGDKVCSSTYDVASLHRIAEAFKRKPVLWDNYPVNDGERASQFLHLKAFEDRPSTLQASLSAHMVNPMNQAQLSKIPLLSLIDSYQEGQAYSADVALESALMRICGPSLASECLTDIGVFQSVGLGAMDLQKRQGLLEKYQTFDDPCAREICDWLQDAYKFDPSCLTG